MSKKDNSKPLTAQEINELVAEGLIKRSEVSDISGMTRMEATKYFADKLRKQEQEWIDGQR